MKEREKSKMTNQTDREINFDIKLGESTATQNYTLKAYKYIDGVEEAYSIGMGFTLIKAEVKKEDNGK